VLSKTKNFTHSDMNLAHQQDKLTQIYQRSEAVGAKARSVAKLRQLRHRRAVMSKTDEEFARFMNLLRWRYDRQVREHDVDPTGIWHFSPSSDETVSRANGRGCANNHRAMDALPNRKGKFNAGPSVFWQRSFSHKGVLGKQ